MTAASKPWNKHRIIGQKRPLKISHIWGIRIRLKMEDNKRDLALFNMALDSKLRGCDLAKLLVSDVMSGGVVMRRALVTQQKTGSPVQFEITEGTRKSVLDWVTFKGLNYSSYLFPSAKVPGEHICTRQYNRIFHSWIEKLGLDRTLYSTHTMRRTKAYLIYKKTKNLRVVQLLLGHKKLESTVRYLGIEVDDALDIAESLDI
ncbi:tyrosine-type recombinase/integrase [Alteromonas sp. RKMC-009]|uniref:tyrosine-type recombinase/integrase n=1 Tax=Alteromonas sp. RKMC-009 TaxID=2267264 RepID=UPI000E69DD66|nr:tyrosine-type recombinase/integrase [Alteromonas sp. RKMC-009]AYA64822.1 integrase [Alteromonas sp. RKMC-009]